jgi:protein-S-isoprenylcysteine O-methyltransferase Ste14
MKPITKGWLYVLGQIILFSSIIILSYIEWNLLKNPHNSFTKYTGLVLIIAGVLGLAASFINFGQMITPNPVPLKNTKLKTNGLYAFVRHPIYFFGIVFFTGFILFHAAYFTSVLLIILFVFIVNKTNFEEKQLIEKFPEYRAYMSKTKRLIPFIY